MAKYLARINEKTLTLNPNNVTLISIVQKLVATKIKGISMYTVSGITEKGS